MSGTQNQKDPRRLRQLLESIPLPVAAALLIAALLGLWVLSSQGYVLTVRTSDVTVTLTPESSDPQTGEKREEVGERSAEVARTN
jgi:hypothetical protein